MWKIVRFSKSLRWQPLISSFKLISKYNGIKWALKNESIKCWQAMAWMWKLCTGFIRLQCGCFFVFFLNLYMCQQLLVWNWQPRIKTYLANAFFWLLNVIIASSSAVDHAPHLGVHWISLKGVHSFGAHLIIYCRVQHCTIRQLCLLR